MTGTGKFDTIKTVKKNRQASAILARTKLQDLYIFATDRPDINTDYANIHTLGASLVGLKSGRGCDTGIGARQDVYFYNLAYGITRGWNARFMQDF